MIQTSPPYKAAITSWYFVDKYWVEGKKGQVNSVIPYKHLCFVTENSEGKGKGVEIEHEVKPIPLLENLNPPSRIGLTNPTLLMTWHDLYFRQNIIL